MELVCTEGHRIQRAYPDPVFLRDDRVLQNLTKMEEHYTVPARFMDSQQDIKPYMRKIVTQWMLEVRGTRKRVLSAKLILLQFLQTLGEAMSPYWPNIKSSVCWACRGLVMMA